LSQTDRLENLQRTSKRSGGEEKKKHGEEIRRWHFKHYIEVNVSRRRKIIGEKIFFLCLFSSSFAIQWEKEIVDGGIEWSERDGRILNCSIRIFMVPSQKAVDETIEDEASS
jgi:hypothetical protein